MKFGKVVGILVEITRADFGDERSMRAAVSMFLGSFSFSHCISSRFIFYSLKTVVKRNCLQSSYTYRCNKMPWRQTVNNSNNIGSYKMQLRVQSSYTYDKRLW